MDNEHLVLRNTVEVVNHDDLLVVLKKPKRRAYIGFEPSGSAHLGWYLLARKIKDLQDAGFDTSVLLADWHAHINDKFDGDMKQIKSCGRYMEKTLLALGVKPDTNFVYASDYIGDPKYWEMVIKVAKASSLNRVKRAMSVMGRKEEDAEIDYSKTLYPVMQVADIFHNKWDLALGGLDQRHAHMLARDVADKLGREKPVALHTPLLASLKASGRMDPIENKMSKSKPEGTIFLSDNEEEVAKKVNGAFCELKNVETNPLLDVAKLILFADEGFELNIDRPEKFGGPVSFASFDALENSFKNGTLHCKDLKNGIASALNKKLEPIRKSVPKFDVCELPK